MALLNILWSCPAAFLLLLLVVAATSVHAAATSYHPHKHANLSEPSLEYYVQVVAGTPDTGELVPALDTNTTNNFGSMGLFAFTVTESADPSSTSLGFVGGFTVEVSYTSTTHQVEVEVLSYDDGHVNGTISLQGLINAATNEVAVMGGTGYFRGVRGYGIISKLSASLFHHSLYFL